MLLMSAVTHLDSNFAVLFLLLSVSALMLTTVNP